MDRAELEAAERLAEVNTRVLLDRDPEQACIYQENAARLIGIAMGTIKPVYRVLHLVNGRPAPTEQEKEVPPAA